jgi:hypothetical protein
LGTRAIARFAARTLESLIGPPPPVPITFAGASYDLIWYQHFHKAGGTSFVQSAHNAGLRSTRNNRNGNPDDAQGKLLTIWTWDTPRLTTWLQSELERSTGLICCEYGFSHEVLTLRQPRVLKLTTIRDPKSRLISNFLYDVRRGVTDARDILSYVNSGGIHRCADFYTQIVTRRSGAQARAEAIAAITAYDYVHVLGAPESWTRLQEMLTIGDAGKLREARANATNYSDSVLAAPRQSVVDADAALDALCEGEMQLFEAVKSHFHPTIS